MTKYLISFPSEATVFPAEDFEAVVEASNSIIEEGQSCRRVCLRRRDRREPRPAARGR